MTDNTNKLNTQYNFAIPTTQEEREKIILLAVKMLTEKEGGNITLNQLLSYVDNNLNNLSNEVSQALINKSNVGHNHDDRYYTENEINSKVNELKSDLGGKINYTDSLSLEEIMASTPPIDLDIGIPKASALKTFSDNISNQINNIAVIPTYSYIDLGSDSSSNEDYFKKWINKIWTTHKDKVGNPIFAKVRPNSEGIVIGHIYNTETSKVKYAGFLYIPDNASMFLFGYTNIDKWYYQQK